MEKSKAARLTRKINPMPAYIKDILEEKGLMEAYKSRPGYQQNDYLWWIADAKREETKTKRLNQMLEELRLGNVYMNMKWNAG